MAVFPGTSILNTGGTGADSPATSPILTVPAGSSGVNIVGFAFTNPSATPITVSIYRNFIGAAVGVGGLQFTITVAALAGMTGGPSIQQQAFPLTLAAGETIYAQTPNLGGIANVEIDGLPAGAASTALTQAQLSLALMLMFHEAFGVDIPDANTLNNGYTFS
jgi:hypothetical protein